MNTDDRIQSDPAGESGRKEQGTLVSRKLPDLIFGAKGAERRINATVGAILVLLVLVAGTAVFFVLTRQLQVQIENGLVGTLADKTSFFHSTMDASAEKVEDIVARHPRLRELLLAVDAGTAGPAELREIGAILGNTLLHRNVSAIELSDVHARVVDTRGEFLRDPIATTALRDPQHTLLYGREALQRGGQTRRDRSLLPEQARYSPRS